jgi:hypothetical protein
MLGRLNIILIFSFQKKMPKRSSRSSRPKEKLVKKEDIISHAEDDGVILSPKEKKLKKQELIDLLERIREARSDRDQKKGSRKSSKKNKIYCGDSDKIPEDEGYIRRGSRYECLRKGVGVGLYIVSKRKEKEYSSERKTEDELLEEENLNIRLKAKKKDFREFFDRNFNAAKKIAKRETDIFYKLARLYYEKERDKDNEEED